MDTGQQIAMVAWIQVLGFDPQDTLSLADLTPLPSQHPVLPAPSMLVMLWQTVGLNGHSRPGLPLSQHILEISFGGGGSMHKPLTVRSIKTQGSSMSLVEMTALS